MRATGTELPSQQRAAEREYEAILEAISGQLAESRFLLGDRPCAVDAIVLGGLLAHTHMDPDPKKVVTRFPRVVQWCTRDALQWDGSGELARFPDSTPFARTILAAMHDTYVPYATGNAKALARGDKAFTASTYGEEVSYLARPYPERSRRMISDRLRDQLNERDLPGVNDFLATYGLGDCFTSGDSADR